jgi:hypothetical protein
MERINAVAALEHERSLPPRETSALQIRSGLYVQPENVVATIREVELKKQIKPPLTPQQIAALADEILKLNPTADRLKAMADSVLRAETFGTLAFQYWIADRLMTWEEMEMERAALGRERRELYKTFNEAVASEIQTRIWNMDAALAEESKAADIKAWELFELESQAAAWREKRVHIRIEAEGRIRRELHDVSEKIKMLDVEERYRLMQDAGMGHDVAICQNLHLFPDKLRDLVK